MRMRTRPLPAARRQQGRDGGERRVAVVGRAPAVEEVALAHGLVRPEPAAPLAERRLLVHVAVDDDGVARAAVVDQEDRGAVTELDDLGLQGRLLVPHPVPEEFGGLRDAAPLGPVGIEGGGEARDAGVLAESGEDPLLPGGVDHDSVTRARRSSVLDIDSAVCWPTLPCLRKTRCLSWLMSQVSVTLVPPSTSSNW